MFLLIKRVRWSNRKKKDTTPFFVEMDTLLTLEQLNQPLQLADFFKPILF